MLSGYYLIEFSQDLPQKYYYQWGNRHKRLSNLSDTRQEGNGRADWVPTTGLWPMRFLCTVGLMQVAMFLLFGDELARHPGWFSSSEVRRKTSTMPPLSCPHLGSHLTLTETHWGELISTILFLTQPLFIGPPRFVENKSPRPSLWTPHGTAGPRSWMFTLKSLFLIENRLCFALPL